MTLGPQCWSCRKRRVRCDSTKPACRKCEQKGIECLGYSESKPVVWIEHAKQPKRRRQKAAQMAVVVRRRHSPSVVDTEVQVADASLAREVLFCSSDLTIVPRSIEYINRYLAPAVDLFDTAFVPLRLNPQLWQDHPPVSHSLFVITATRHRAVFLQQNSIQQRHAREGRLLEMSIYKHLSLAVAEINRLIMIPIPAVRYFLFSIVVWLLVIEIQDSRSKCWSIHLEGARELLHRLGSLDEIIATAPDFVTSMLPYFILIDVLKIPTLSTRGRTRWQSQAHYLPHISTLFGDGLNTVIPCPDELIAALIEINDLRLYSLDKNSTTLIEQASNLATRLLAYSPQEWVRRTGKIRTTNKARRYCEQRHREDPYVLEYIPPNIDILNAEHQALWDEQWLQTISTYQSATLIYCLRSLMTTHFDYNAKIIPSSTKTIADIIYEHTQLLFSNLEKIFNEGNRKFPLLVFWPLFISGLEIRPHEQKRKSFVRDSLRLIAVEVGSLSPVHAIEILENHWARPQQNTTLHSEYNWNATFANVSTECIFLW